MNLLTHFSASQSPYNGLNLLFRDSFLPGDDFDF